MKVREVFVMCCSNGIKLKPIFNSVIENSEIRNWAVYSDGLHTKLLISTIKWILNSIVSGYVKQRIEKFKTTVIWIGPKHILNIY